MRGRRRATMYVMGNVAALLLLRLLRSAAAAAATLVRHTHIFTHKGGGCKQRATTASSAFIIF